MLTRSVRGEMKLKRLSANLLLIPPSASLTIQERLRSRGGILMQPNVDVMAHGQRQRSPGRSVSQRRLGAKIGAGYTMLANGP